MMSLLPLLKRNVSTLTGLVVLLSWASVVWAAPWSDMRLRIDIEPIEKSATSVVLHPEARPLPPFDNELFALKYFGGPCEIQVLFSYILPSQ